ncbi:MAG: STAS domain-containing protein [Lacipirellulaceae bacterium]
MLAVETQGAVEVVSLNAPLDSQNADELAESISQRCAHGQPAIVIDLKNTPLIDSAGLESLVDVQQMAAKRGGSVKLSGPNPLCADILHVSGMNRRFEVFETAKAAVGSFAG